jgi:hypothetical protein
LLKQYKAKQIEMDNWKKKNNVQVVQQWWISQSAVLLLKYMSHFERPSLFIDTVVLGYLGFT